MPSFPTSSDLHDLDPETWEALCARCGWCCLHKLEDEVSGEVYYTAVACRLLDHTSCTCRDYENRATEVADCLDLHTQLQTALPWLPPSCAYRLLHEGKPLPAWHPLVSGSFSSPEQAGVTVSRFALPEEGVDLEDLSRYILRKL
ncbi:MAG: hypothetical protein A2284_16080 [Deltaproteobacteria bacterium RIFOXYA12_FULL_61_11]|nr:MAG: hypothetical protein A2284_16080 [Deltaproteobacteria bacterium RIFOXYA12_FULL_61_11]